MSTRPDPTPAARVDPAGPAMAMGPADAPAAAMGPAGLAPVRPSFGWMLQHPARPFALGFGCGLSPWAPGTVGTLWAWLAFLLFRDRFSDGQMAVLLLGATAFGVVVSTLTARHLRTADPGAIVWDEVVAFWLVLWLVTPAGLLEQAFAFGLFRYFDAAKPGPVGWADRRYKGVRGAPIGWRQGWGVMVDDLVAAACTLLVFALWRAW